MWKSGTWMKVHYDQYKLNQLSDVHIGFIGSMNEFVKSKLFKREKFSSAMCKCLYEERGVIGLNVGYFCSGSHKVAVLFSVRVQKP